MFNQKLTALQTFFDWRQDLWEQVPEDLKERMAKVDKGPLWSGEYDQEQLDRVREDMGITRPVKIIADPDMRADIDGVLWGQWQYDPRFDEDGHTILIQPDISLEVAHEILAHELTHAKQLDRDGWHTIARQNQEMEFNKLLFGFAAYENDPMEVEAHKATDELADKLNILKAHE